MPQIIIKFDMLQLIQLREALKTGMAQLGVHLQILFFLIYRLLFATTIYSQKQVQPIHIKLIGTEYVVRQKQYDNFQKLSFVV